MRLAIAVLAAAALAGCSDGPLGEQEKEVKVAVGRHFAELNAQAAARAQEAKLTKSDVDLPATALVLNRYDWDLNGAIYPDVECSNAACKAKLGKLASVGVELRCPECGQELMTELTRVGKSQPMFESKSTGLPIVVIVRYVRKSYAYDPTSSVLVSSKTESVISTKAFTDPENRAKGGFYANGLYRVTGTAIGTTGFVYRGGELHEIDPESVKKMVKDPPETVSVSSMKLGRWGGVEEPLTPWLGKPPTEAPAKAPPKTP
jgi:hypothetical protein